MHTEIRYSVAIVYMSACRCGHTQPLERPIRCVYKLPQEVQQGSSHPLWAVGANIFCVFSKRALSTHYLIKFSEKFSWVSIHMLIP